MNQFSFKGLYRRNLPHVQPESATFFITFRLANSLPIEVIQRLAEENAHAEKRLMQIADKHERQKQSDLERRRFFGKWDDTLDTFAHGEKFLSNPDIANLVSESLHFRNGKVFDLAAFCIMPNHVHLVCTPLKEAGDDFYSLSKIMHSLKRHTARQANLLLNRTGSFWQYENYDHYARDDAELERIIEYVLQNPVKAGLVEKWEDWKWTFSEYVV